MHAMTYHHSALKDCNLSLEKPNLAMEGHDLHPKRLSGLKVEQRSLVSCQLSTDVSSIDTEQSGGGFFFIRCR